MVAYSYKKRFINPIADGTKTHTLRMERKRHANVGEPIQQYFGMRTKHCRKIIDDPICTLRLPVTLVIGPLRFIGIRGRYTQNIPGEYWDDFAVRDGFENSEEMHAYWLAEHGEKWLGVQLIGWDQNPPEYLI